MFKHQKTLIVLIAALLFLISGCKVSMYVEPSPPKQGDLHKINIAANFPSKIESISYKINDISGTIQTGNHSVNYNSCKSSGTYLTKLNLWAEAKWENGRVSSFNKVFDLTVSSDSRENSSLTYGMYVANDNDDETENQFVSWANAFNNRFNQYSSYDYFWTSPNYYNCSYLCAANKHDLVISIGHGNDHIYKAGNSSSDIVNLSQTAYGAFHPCNNVGDLEHLVFASCQVLSTDNSGGHDFTYYWVHNYSTRTENRPFSGLHTMSGFKTNFVVNYSIFHNDGNAFLNQFAKNLNDKMSVCESWLDAAGDELDMDDGDNKAAVIYLKPYENDKITTRKSDYIYLNSNYNLWIWEWE